MTFSIRAWFIFSVVLASIGLIASWFLVLAAPTQTAPSVSRRAPDTPEARGMKVRRRFKKVKQQFKKVKGSHTLAAAVPLFDGQGGKLIALSPWWRYVEVGGKSAAIDTMKEPAFGGLGAHRLVDPAHGRCRRHLRSPSSFGRFSPHTGRIFSVRDFFTNSGEIRRELVSDRVASPAPSAERGDRGS